MLHGERDFLFASLLLEIFALDELDRLVEIKLGVEGFLVVPFERGVNLQLDLLQFLFLIQGFEGSDAHDLAKDAGEFGAEPIGSFPFDVDVLVRHGVYYSRSESGRKAFLIFFI